MAGKNSVDLLHNRALERLQAGEPSIGIVAAINSATTAAVLAQAGCDHVLLDSQHGELDERTRLEAIRAVALQGVTPIVRVVSNDYAHIGRALDAGAVGIIVPMVNTAKQAAAAAFAMRYPPDGGRSAAPPLAIHFDDSYGGRANQEVFLAVQIESAEALANVDDIMATPGVDGCWLGPADLALSLGVQMESAEHTAALQAVADACANAGKFSGMFAATPAIANRWIDKGYQLVTVDGDLHLLGTAAAALLAQLP